MRRNPQDGAFRGPRVYGGLLMTALVFAGCASDSIAGGGGNGDGDAIAPVVTLAANQVPTSVGPTDAVVIQVQAQEEAAGSGLQSVGAVIVAGGSVTSASATLTGQASATRQFSFPVSALPFAGATSLQLEYYGWAVDVAGNCTLAGADAARRTCTIQNGAPVIGDFDGIAATVRLIDIRTFQGLAPGAQYIGDLVFDATRGRVYVSNKADNAIEVLDWSGDAFARAAPVHVGSLPWGMTIDRSGDTLIVANSGGTSLSYVDLAGAAEARRFETPNAVLYQLTPADDAWVLDHTDFSDRPQHVAQDAAGFVIYSTQPTQAAPSGSLRWVESEASWSRKESDLMLWTQVVDKNSWGPGSSPAPCVTIEPDGCVIAFVDSAKIIYENPFLGTGLGLYDHLPGSPGTVIADTAYNGEWELTAAAMRARGSDIFFYYGVWQYDDWVTGDTTFVAASGDGEWISIAEGAANPGRVWMWGELGAHPRDYDRFISNVVNIADYVSNTSDQVTGVSLNQTGLVLASRSASQVFFFTNPLRLRGTFMDPAIVGGSGIALHPAASFDTDAPATNWAAVGGAGNEIVLVDTRHFRRVGALAVGEPVSGALRVVGPQPGDDADVVGHIFGVTRSGGIFEVAVRTSDIDG